LKPIAALGTPQLPGYDFGVLLLLLGLKQQRQASSANADGCGVVAV
jgi:hypothetical protein